MNDIPVRNAISTTGPDDVRYTLTVIDSFMRQGASKQYVVTRARDAIARELRMCARPPRGIDEMQLVHARGIWRWMRENIAFVHDPVDDKGQTELLADCEVILRHRSGDCDEHCILAGAMLGAVGFRQNQLILTVGGPYDPVQQMHVPIHVFLTVRTLGGQQVVFDSTLDKPFGTSAGDKTWKYWNWRPEPN